MSEIDIDAASPTEAQIEIERFALDGLRRATNETIATTPFLLNAMRLTVDESGELRHMTEQEYVTSLSPVEQSNYANLGLQLERQQLALEGKIPISEGMRQRKADEFRQLQEQSARLGDAITGDAPESAMARSTSGIQRLKAFNDRWSLAEDAERRAEIQTGQANIMTQMGTISNLRQKDVEQITSTPSRHLLAMSPYQQQSGLLNTANIYEAQANAARQRDLLGLAATGGGFLLDRLWP